jgi:hypothetical protein
MLTHKEETAKTEVPASAYLDSLLPKPRFLTSKNAKKNNRRITAWTAGFVGLQARTTLWVVLSC